MELMNKKHDFKVSESKEGETRRILTMEKISETMGHITLHKKFNDTITDTFKLDAQIVYEADSKLLTIQVENEAGRYNLSLKQVQDKIRKFFNVNSINIFIK